LSDFRDDIIDLLINAGEHPMRVYLMLNVIQDALADKYQDAVSEEDNEYRTALGLHEALCFIRNLRMDIAHEYGYMVEGK
jgi:hypothetical protein